MLTAQVLDFGAPRIVTDKEALVTLRAFLPVLKQTQKLREETVNVDNYDVLLDRSSGWGWGISQLHRVVTVSMEVFNDLNNAMNRGGTALATFDIPSAAPRLKTIGPDLFHANSTLGPVEFVRSKIERAVQVLEARVAAQQPPPAQPPAQNGRAMTFFVRYKKPIMIAGGAAAGLGVLGGLLFLTGKR